VSFRTPRDREGDLDPVGARLLWSRRRMGQRHLLLLLALAGPARAAEETELASSFDDDDPFDFNIKVGYLRESRQAAIKREFQCDRSRPAAEYQECLEAYPAIGVAKDLRYRQLRNVLNLRGEIGIWQDLQIHVEAPLVLGDHRKLRFDHETDGPCITPNEVRPGGDTTNDMATCVSSFNSTSANDGLLRGIDRDNYDRELVAGEDIDENATQGYHLPARSGLDQLHVGIDWGALSQERDDTKPTWVVGVEWRIPVDDPMTYDPENPTLDTNVGRGIHELKFSTSMSKRWTYVEPFMGFWYIYPKAKESSQFLDYRGGQDKFRPQMRAGTEFGFEIIPWQVPEEKQKFSIELGGAVRAHFEGRGYSEMWEVFSRNPQLDGPCRPGGSDPDQDQVWVNCDRGIDDADSPDFDGDGRPDGLIEHPGVTDIENYLTLGSHAAVRVQMGEWVKFRIGVGLEYDQEHIITFTDGGEEINGNGRIDPSDPQEVHPMFRPLIDQTGRRYRVEDTFVFNFFAQGTLLF